MIPRRRLAFLLGAIVAAPWAPLSAEPAPSAEPDRRFALDELGVLGGFAWVNAPRQPLQLFLRRPCEGRLM
jgi:hypothetical protein